MMRERRKGRQDEPASASEPPADSAPEQRPEAPETPVSEAAPSTVVDVDQCLDALATALRAWGRMSFDLQGTLAVDVGQTFESWARHVLLNTPPPDKEEWQSQQRDWPGLGHFVREHRSEERDFVITSLDDLRGVVWIFLESFSKALAADRSADNRVLSQLSSLREAVKSNDTGALKQQASTAATLVEGVISVREARYEGQIERLSDRLDNLAAQLIATREQGELDPLTGAQNRAALDRHLTQMTHLGAVLGRCAIAFMIDIDHFKWVNDRFGHQVGDDLLRRVRRRLRQTLRRQDDFLGRYGGDEFVAIVQSRNEHEAKEVGERLAFAVREVEVEGPDGPIRVSVSVGAALLRPGDDANSWLERADRAMYQAKQDGRDRVVVETSSEDS